MSEDIRTPEEAPVAEAPVEATPEVEAEVVAEPAPATEEETVA